MYKRQQFADNRQYVVGVTLPVLLKEGQYDAAQKLLATLPANEMLEERYAVSVATRNKAEALRLARLLYQHCLLYTSRRHRLIISGDFMLPTLLARL